MISGKTVYRDRRFHPAIARHEVLLAAPVCRLPAGLLSLASVTANRPPALLASRMNSAGMTILPHDTSPHRGIRQRFRAVWREPRIAPSESPTVAVGRDHMRWRALPAPAPLRHGAGAVRRVVVVERRAPAFPLRGRCRCEATTDEGDRAKRDGFVCSTQCCAASLNDARSSRSLLRRFARQQRAQAVQAEALIWRAVRNRRCDGAKFQRQVPLDNYIVDFVYFEHRLIVERRAPAFPPCGGRCRCEATTDEGIARSAMASYVQPNVAQLRSMTEEILAPAPPFRPPTARASRSG